VKGITTNTSEQPWLTYAVNLLASGKTPQQIARKLYGNVSPETIQLVLANPSINAFLAAKGVATGAVGQLGKKFSQIKSMPQGLKKFNALYAPPQQHFSKHPLLPFTIVQYLLLLVGIWLSIITLKAANNVSSTLEYTSSSCTPCYVQKKMKGFADTLIAFYVFAIVFFLIYASTRHFRNGTFQMINKGARMLLSRGMTVASPYTTAFKWFIKLAVIGSFIIITVMVFVDFFHKVVYGYKNMYDSSTTTTAVPSSSSTSTNTAKSAYIWCIFAFIFFLMNIVWLIVYFIQLRRFNMTIF
jgi:hypothetical protein